MTNMKSANIKLKERSLRILMAETGLDEAAASELLNKSGDDLRVALLVFQTSAQPEEAKKVLSENDFVIERAVSALRGKA
jgi:N-acetylmuramic acid 6-phosphate etherase